MHVYGSFVPKPLPFLPSVALVAFHSLLWMLMEGINGEGLETRLCFWYVRVVVGHNLKITLLQSFVVRAASHRASPSLLWAPSLDVSLSDILVQFRTILQYRYGGVA